MIRQTLLIGILWLASAAFCPLVSAEPLQQVPQPAAAEQAEKNAGEKNAAAKKDARQKKDERKYIRLLRDAKRRPTALQTIVARYVAAGKENQDVRVDLIGAVHVGEKSYYQALNRDFEKYDVLLYELVAPKGTKIPKGGGGGGGHPVRMLQVGMQRMLDLEFQLEQIDYTKKNFVHADMSPEQFSKSMNSRGESFFRMFLNIMAKSMAQQSTRPNRTSDMELLLALLDRNRSLALKRVLAEQFEDLGGMMEVLDGPDGSTILTERNKVALEVLKKQIAAGNKRIGIFYGAGHLRDMEQRLLADFHMKHSQDRWITAWDLKSKSPSPKKRPPAKIVPPRTVAP